MRVVLAARRSALARLQAQLVAMSLREKHPRIEIEFRYRESLGDQRQDTPLWEMPEKGVFTEDLREELRDGSCDLVVHSWKDLPIEENSRTEIVATLPRADARDLLLVRADRWAGVERSGAISLLTSSPRRVRNLGAFLPEALPGGVHTINFLPVRGNIPTRVRKMWEQEADGLILAKAAMDRLLEAEAGEFAETAAELRRALAQCRWMALPLSENPTAPAQGALAIEIARHREDLRQALAEINCAATFGAARREREILRSHGGGCHQAIGVSVLERAYGEITIVRGSDEQGRELSQTILRPVRPRPEKRDRAELWPRDPSENLWFSREPVAAMPPDEGVALWIAKADAAPEAWPVPASRIVWTGGLKTWRRLARRGVWVHGSAESLGQDEAPRIDTLAGPGLRWTRLSHSDAGEDPKMPALATYRLRPLEAAIDLRGRRYFFWTSGSNFRQALASNGWLREMTHFCGPGNTQQALRQAGIDPHIFLDHRQWLAEMSL
ncbi:MAG: hydroxymethylbilane synthase [Blastocatellia bacterium]